MWWPLTGKVWPDGTPRDGADAAPRIDTGGLVFEAVPGDISEFNRLAAADAPYEITALSVRAWASVADRYVITRVGSSVGDGYGPKVVCPPACGLTPGGLRDPSVRIAVPGRRTSAFMALCIALDDDGTSGRFIEAPFDRIIPMVARGEADAGLVIHEGQVQFADAGLSQVLDLGEWWKRTRGLPLPLGVNAIRRDAATALIAPLLAQSLAYALEHRAESVDYTLAFAAVNARAAGLPEPTRAVVERYVDMYVTGHTVDLGDDGVGAIERFLAAGAERGLCPRVGRVDVV